MPFAAPGQGLIWRSGRRVTVGDASYAPVPSPDILLDFVNGVYVSDGSSYPSAAAAGFAGTGTFGSSGYVATGSQWIRAGVAVPASWIALVEYELPPLGQTSTLWSAQFGGNAMVTANASGVILANHAPATSNQATRLAYGSSGGVIKQCFTQGSVLNGTTTGIGGGGLLYIGNSADGSSPWVSPIRKFAIYYANALTDDQIRTLT